MEALLADLGPRLRRAQRPADPGDGSRSDVPCRWPTGLPEVDRVLDGGLPGGRLSEIHGPPGSGRTSLALSLLAGLTRRGECAAVVDRADALDPASAREAGVDLERLLWVRSPDWRRALGAAERLLGTQGLPLVLLDGAPEALASGARDAVPGGAAWWRLARRAAATRTALVLLSRERLAGACAEVTLALEAAGVRFSSAPALLEEVESRAVVARRRDGPAGRAAPVRRRPDRAA